MDWYEHLTDMYEMVTPYMDKFVISFALSSGYLFSKRFIKNTPEQSTLDLISMRLERIEKELMMINQYEENSDSCIDLEDQEN